MIRFLRHNRLLLLAFAVTLTLAIYFGATALKNAAAFRNAPPDQVIEGWMTPRYVAHSWDIPREVMTSLGFERGTDGPRPLNKIAEDRGIPIEALIGEIEAAIAAHRAEAGQ
jgi:hypothetical protein